MSARPNRRAELVALLADEPIREESLSPERSALRECAALLSMFDPTTLSAPGMKPGNWRQILADCEPVDGPNGLRLWRLKPQVRRIALKDMQGIATMRSMWTALPSRPNDPVQRAIDRLVTGTGPDIAALSREDLAALAQAGDWFDGIVPLVDPNEIADALLLSEVLAPLRKLDDGHFVGRVSELVVLEDYVGYLDVRSLSSVVTRSIRAAKDHFTDRPPLFVYGPGGVGKSTLIAHFVLTHLRGNPNTSLPFIYLDIDRPPVDPKRPLTLLLEAIKQLKAQFKESVQSADKVSEAIQNALGSDDPTDAVPEYNQEGLIFQFSDWVKLFLPQGARFLFVLDTFEEVQFLGTSTVRVVWDLLEALQMEIPMARIVVAGRAAPSKEDEIRFEPLALDELDEDSAMLFLERKVGEGVLDTARKKEIVALVGRSPLAIRLAADVVKRGDADQLRNLSTRNTLLFKVKSEKVAAQLYGRVLAHIHDKNVRALAYPGLILRRVTPEVIEEVLAEPCGLKLSKELTAKQLFQALSREITIVEPGGDGSIRHRADLRRLMLADLLSNVPAETAKAIDRNAVAYYSKQKGTQSRAEEIYHRLRLGEAGAALDKRWIPGVDFLLRGAFEELGPSARLWLCRKLDITPDKHLLSLASQEDWENHARREAERYLQHNAPEAALKVLRGRSKRLPGSSLFRLEAEAHLALQDDRGACDVAQKGFVSAIGAGNAEAAVDLRVFQVGIAESNDDLNAAFTMVEEMADLIGPATPPLIALRALIPRIRIRRQLTLGFDLTGAALLKQANALITLRVLQDLRATPMLLRAAAAELGAINSDILIAVLQSHVVDPAKTSLTAMLASMSSEVEVSSDGLGLFKTFPKNFEAWLAKTAFPVIMDLLIALLKRVTPESQLRAWVMDLCRGGATAAPPKPVKSPPKARLSKRRLR